MRTLPPTNNTAGTKTRLHAGHSSHLVMPGFVNCVHHGDGRGGYEGPAVELPTWPQGLPFHACLLLRKTDVPPHISYLSTLIACDNDPSKCLNGRRRKQNAETSENKCSGKSSELPREHTECIRVTQAQGSMEKRQHHDGKGCTCRSPSVALTWSRKVSDVPFCLKKRKGSCATISPGSNFMYLPHFTMHERYR